MRTKALLLGAAVGAVTLATSMAQGVYSVNIVGYVNTTIPHGWSIVCNPLNCSGGNLIRNVMPAPPVPEGSTLTVFAYVNSSGLYNKAVFQMVRDEDTGELIPSWILGGTMDVSPGKGLFVNNTGTNFTWTFVGEVPTGTALTNQIGTGFNLVSSVVPKTGKLATELGYQPSLGASGTYDNVLKYVNATGLYQRWQWIGFDQIDEDTGETIPPHWGSGGEPIINVGEGVWIWRGGLTGTTWTQSFSVGS